MNKHIAKLFAFFLIASFSSLSVANSGFPGRQVYVDVNTIEMEDLHKRLSEFILVDVRSRFEYNTMHIKNALHLPVAEKTFNDDIRSLYRMARKPVVFYCNGVTCLKSYQAARSANVIGGINSSKVMAFDAGMLAWAKAHPKDSILLGQSPLETNLLIADTKFNKHLLGFNEFKAEADKGAVVIDVRDAFQRNGKSLFPGKDTNIPLDKSAKMHSIIMKAKEDGKTVLVYDAVGRQVRWLQYALEKEGLSEYYFLKGGAAAK